MVNSPANTDGISRMGKAWLTSLPNGDELFFKDKDHGGKTEALVALLIERFKRELLNLADKFEWDLRKMIFRKIEQAGSKSIITGVYNREDYYQVTMPNFKPEHPAFGCSVSKKSFGDQALRFAIYLRHLYNHYFYGEEYHTSRNDKELLLPNDAYLKKLNIPPVPDMPYLNELIEFTSEPPENAIRERKKVTVGNIQLQASMPSPRNYKKEHIEPYNFPKVQGVSYSEAHDCFYASYGDDKTAFHVGGNDPKKVFARAVALRHQIFALAYGDQYHKARNKDDNSMPNDKLLKELEIEPYPDRELS